MISYKSVAREPVCENSEEVIVYESRRVSCQTLSLSVP